MSNLILGLMFGLFLTSCAPQIERDKSSKKIYGEKSVGIPLDLIISQKKCSDDESAIYHQSLMTQAGKNSNYNVFLTKDSDLIRNSEFAGEFHANTQLALLFHPDVISASEKFDLCRIDRPYEYNSYQDATVSIMAPIRKFENNFSTLVKNLKLDPVNIRTAPKLKQGSTYLINNAFYYSGTNEITFLPQGFSDSEDKNLPFGGVPFWKFPMVSLHEYGHHIFAQIYRRANPVIIEREKEKEKESHVSLCFDNSNEFTESDSRMGETRLVTKILAISAINEGYADLFAYYADPKSRSLKKMGCLAKSREIESSRFYNDELKILDVNMLEDFLSNEYKAYQGCYRDTNYQDIHIIGAVLARGFYVLLEKRSISDNKRMEILVDWLKNFTKKVGSYESPEEAFKLAINLFYKTSRSHVTLGKDDCTSYFSHFPLFDDNRCF